MAGGACCVSSGSGCTGCGGCGGACSAGCTACTSCTGGCKNSCSGACGSGCSSGCSGCSGSCSGCSGSCKGTCKATCADNCTGGCKTTCSGGCKTGCAETCDATCAGECMSNCTGQAMQTMATNLFLEKRMNSDNFNDIQQLIAYEIDRRKLIPESSQTDVGDIISVADIQSIINDLDAMDLPVEEHLRLTAAQSQKTKTMLGRNIIDQAKKAYSEFVQLIPPL